MTWILCRKPVKRQFVIFVTLELLVQWLNLLFFVIPNIVLCKGTCPDIASNFISKHSHFWSPLHFSALTSWVRLVSPTWAHCSARSNLTLSTGIYKSLLFLCVLSAMGFCLAERISCSRLLPIAFPEAKEDEYIFSCSGAKLVDASPVCYNI